ncbi:MAG: histone deacetylase [Caldilineaceae bacterium]|jgi:acetoin utilization deacetylase AcuC-like enzyme
MNRTAISYDTFNRKHSFEGHPENFRRMEAIWSLLESDGILETLIHVPTRPAPMDAILKVHTEDYIQRLRAICEEGGGRLDTDTYITPDSFHAAELAAGGLIEVVDTVLRGDADNGFALIRPPGHHAYSDWGTGFCLMNNPAIAARWAQEQYNMDRILIVDFDVHHGNGTQDIFYFDPTVMFFSIHQYPFYPRTGAATDFGLYAGTGSTVNVPFPGYVGDTGYLAAFHQILGPAAYDFEPELIIVSAGYDAHWMDPLASMRVSIRGYYEMVGDLMRLAHDLCDGYLVFELEGGYQLDVLAHSVLTTLRRLQDAGQGPSDPFGPAPGEEKYALSLVEQLRAMHGLSELPYNALPPT